MRTTIRPFVLLLVLAVACVAVGAGLARAAPVSPGSATFSAPVFVLTGGGYGHGVGLSQYGAFAQATAGRSYREILAFYYRGTTLARSPVTKVRVLVSSGRRSVRIGSAVPFRVRDAAGAVLPLPAGDLIVRPDLAISVDGVTSPFAGPISFLPGRGAPLTVDGKGYRGELRVTSDGETLQVVDVVGLDAYLLGVVPGEVPREWPAEALMAQAVAARSYAVASMVRGKQWDLYADVRSQAYYGVEREAPSTTAAVQATRGEVLTYDGKVAAAFYSSSSGGRTAASEDVFGMAYGYLRSVEDPWDDASPYHRWEPRTYTAAGLAAALGLASPVDDVQAAPTPSGRPSTVTVTTRAGQTVELRAIDVRIRLGLRSTAFRIGVLRLERPPATVLPGVRIRVGGIARDVGDAVLQKLDTNGAWATAVRLVPAADGAFTVTLRPRRTATYRLAAAGIAGPVLTLTIPSGASA